MTEEKTEDLKQEEAQKPTFSTRDLFDLTLFEIHKQIAGFLSLTDHYEIKSRKEIITAFKENMEATAKNLGVVLKSLDEKEDK